MAAVQKVHIQGFKSIRDQELEFGPLNVFIGGNGAGKSNLVDVFHFLRQVYRQGLQTYTGQAGGANTILHYGRKQTPKLSVSVEFSISPGGEKVNIYEFDLIPTDDDRFLFEREKLSIRDKVRHPKKSYDESMGGGHAEARLTDAKTGIAVHLREHMDSYRIYHFHDTSSSTAVKQTGDLHDNRFLKADAGNLAAFLYRLQEKTPDHFKNIEDTVRQVAPFFRRFSLQPNKLNPEKIRLEWEDKGGDGFFGAATLSDGTLRFICLATLLLQPELPSLILIDEPELGLHPAAIQILSGLLKTASTRTQLIVATQSVTLINQLEPEQVWVVDRENGQSVFRHLQSADMTSWLDEYSLGELWEKNILGGRP